MSSMQILDPVSCPLHGSRLIEASAGTGKTFTIALLYLRLVLGHRPGEAPGQGLTPPEILVVTFTNAATGELRDRIRARLSQAAVVFDQPPGSASADSTDPLLRIRDSIPVEHWPGCVYRLQQAAEWMDEAAVSTIHGWCQRMLNEHAFHSGSAFAQQMQRDMDSINIEAVRDYWRHFVYPLGAGAATLLTHKWPTPRAMNQPLQSVIGLLEDIEGPAVPPAEALATVSEPLAQLKRQWQELAEETNARVTQAIEKKQFDGRKLRTDGWAKAVSAIEDWANDPLSLAPDLTPAMANRLTPAGMAEAQKGEHGLDAMPAWALLEQVAVLAQTLEQQLQAVLRHAAGWVAQRVTGQKQRLGTIGPDDLLVQLDRALQGPSGAHLAEVIRGQFPAAMIDEFQDTDPLQYRIFNAVYQLADNHKDQAVFLIGDPKQAIYGFRGADIHAYLQARHDTSGRHYSLARNFRSSESMVAAVNRVFAHAQSNHPEGAFRFADGQGETLGFTEVVAKGRGESWVVEGQQPAALQFWHQALDGKPTKADVQAMLAQACADKITRLLNLGAQRRAGFQQGETLAPLRSGDIAVLVNTGEEARLVRAALRRLGVRSVYLSEKHSVLNTPVAVDVLRWLCACAEPQRLSLLRAALASPTLGMDDAQLALWQQDELALEDEIQRFQELHRLWQRRGVLPMLRRLLMLYQVPARLLQMPDGERALTDVLHIAEILQAASQQLDGELALIRHYRDLLDNGADDKELTQMRLESDADLVQVVTVHKSKGLEYPLVFLPFAMQARPVDGKYLPLVWHDEKGQRRVAMVRDERALQAAERARLSEDVRKLYVALTRARHATWVGALALKGWEESGLGTLLAGAGGGVDLPQSLAGLASLDSATAITALPLDADRKPYQAGSPPPLGDALVPRRRAGENWWIASYSALAAGARGMVDAPLPDTARAHDVLDEDADIQARRPTTARGVHAFPGGRIAGTFIHGAMEWAAQQGFAQLTQSPQLLVDEITLRCQRRGWQAQARLLSSWLQSALSATLLIEPQATSLAGLTSYRAEMEFWLEARHVEVAGVDALVGHYLQPGQARPVLAPEQLNGMLKGFVDLVFEHAGRYYVLDYKSNRLGETDDDYSESAMRLAMLDKRYELQSALYLLALHRLLLARLPGYQPQQHLGGALTWFLRGCEAPGHGVVLDRPPVELIEKLASLFAGRREGAE